jgi:hypothetical protein
MEIQSQIGPDGLPVPLPMYHDDLRAKFCRNQMVKQTITPIGAQKQRSVAQLNLYWACCKEVADNTDDQKWNTKEKVDFQCRVILDFRDKSYIAVRPDGTVQFKYRSISFKNLKHMEACNYFTRAFDVMAGFLGVTVEDLVRMAQEHMGQR